MSLELVYVFKLKDSILKVQALDKWVNVTLGDLKGKREIVVITCPKCKTPIRKSRRYGKELKQQFLDIETVKAHVSGNKEQLIQRRKVLEKELEVFAEATEQRSNFKSQFELAIKLLELLKKPEAKDLNEDLLARLENMFRFLKSLGDIQKEVSQIPQGRFMLKKEFIYVSDSDNQSKTII